MKFRCERDVLAEALGTCGRAVAGRAGASPVLSGVRLRLEDDRLDIVGSDRELTIEASITVANGQDGVCVVPARLAADIVRSLEPGAVTVEVADEDVRITSGRSQFAVRMLPTDEFPTPTRPPGDGVTLPAHDLADALRQVVRAASNDDARAILTGVLMSAQEDGLRLVATDSYRLAMRDLPGTTVLREGQKVLVPSRALAELQRLLSGAGEVTLRLGEHDASFEVAPGRSAAAAKAAAGEANGSGAGSDGDAAPAASAVSAAPGNGGDRGGTASALTSGGSPVRLTTRLLEGEYPDYTKILPDNYPNRLIVGRDGLLDALRRVRLLVRDGTTSVRMAMRNDGIELTVVSQEVGQAVEDVDAKYEGTEMTIAFNPGYLIDGVEAIDGDEVLLEALDASKPVTLRATDGSSYLYLLMPVRVP